VQESIILTRVNERPRVWQERRFAVFLGGSLVSWIGDWMDITVVSWAVLQWTNSPVDLALVNACRLIPVFAMSVPAGILADRYDRRRLLIVLQAAMVLLTLAIGVLFAMRFPFWTFAVVLAIRSSLTSMVLPIRSAMIPNLVSPSVQGEAIALYTAAMNLSRIIGPAIAGWLLTVVAAEEVFWINCGCLTVGVATLFVVRLEGQSLDRGKRTVTSDLAEAAAYIRSHRSVQSLLILSVVPMIFGFPYIALMPLFARDLYDSGSEGFGTLLAISAFGALTGAGLLSYVATDRRAGRRLLVSIVVFGAALLTCAATRNFTVAAVSMFVVGLSSQFYRTLSRIMLQAEVPDGLRGRVVSIAMLDRGLIPLGAMLLGSIAAAAGAHLAMIVMGVSCIGLTFAVVAADRRIWRM
jgi:MFS family permease